MSSLPHVTDVAREKVAREFDDLGPEACTAEIVSLLERRNPELLEMISNCARDIQNPARILTSFAIFYRLLEVAACESEGGIELNQLPRVAPETRDLLIKVIDERGPEAFTMDTI